MVKPLIAVVGVLLILSSCAYLISFERKKFTLYKQFKGNTYGLRTDGIYLHKDSSGYTTFTVLYDDGTVFGVNTSFSTDDSLPQGKSNVNDWLGSWGAFNITPDRKIAIQTFGLDQSPYRYYIGELKGDLINDTSFLITEYTKRNKHRKYIRYTFYRTANKGDSTNWTKFDKKLNGK